MTVQIFVKIVWTVFEKFEIFMKRSGEKKNKKKQHDFISSRKFFPTPQNKLTYPYEYVILDHFQEPIYLTKEDFCSTLKQETPPDEEINRTQDIIEKFSIKNAQKLTMLY